MTIMPHGSRWGLALLAAALTGCAAPRADKPIAQAPPGDPAMQLGNFSVSLAVKDLAASRAFYEKLGFTMTGGNGTNWAIMQNQTAAIGLFQGMFDRNILTFNPGWDARAQPLADFQDIRDLQRELQRRGLTLTTTADQSSTGPASLTLVDPDGNPILIDQHVPRPAK